MSRGPNGRFLMPEDKSAESAPLKPAVSAPPLETVPPPAVSGAATKETPVKPGELDEFSKKLVDDTAPLPVAKPAAPAVVPDAKPVDKSVDTKPKTGGVSGVVIGAGLAILAGGLAVFLRRGSAAPSSAGAYTPAANPRASSGGGWAQ